MNQSTMTPRAKELCKDFTMADWQFLDENAFTHPEIKKMIENSEDIQEAGIAIIAFAKEYAKFISEK